MACSKLNGLLKLCLVNQDGCHQQRSTTVIMNIKTIMVCPSPQYASEKKMCSGYLGFFSIFWTQHRQLSRCF